MNGEQDAPLHVPPLQLPTLQVPMQCVCEVWFADLGRHLGSIEDEERRSARLSPDEILRAERISDPDQRRLWRASHIALRDILERSCGPAIRRVPFVSKVGGRPELAPELNRVLNRELTRELAREIREAPEISFSLSHTANVALIGISRAGPIGVDIEALHTRAFSEARRQKIEAIALDIAAGRALPVDQDRRFLQAWTRVEALSKADGRGVLHTLGSPGGTVQEATGKSVRSIEVRDLEVGAGFCASVAGRDLPVALVINSYDPGRIPPL